MGIEALERDAMKTFLATCAVVFTGVLAIASSVTNAPTVILAVGAPGQPEYGSNFVQQVRLWEKLCQEAGARTVRIGLGATNALEDYELLKQALAAEPTDSTEPLWLALIGHGTFDGKVARFNLRGPDVSNAELAEWLKPFRRLLVVVNCASGSAPFLKSLSATNRVVITATRSGNELNFPRFGEHFATALAEPGSDLDKDDQVSLLEAFLVASREAAEFYKSDGRLITEHALIDDNGDGLGTPADWFRGVRAIKKAQEGASPDGVRANQLHLVRSAAEQALPADVRARCGALELELARLRDSKPQMSEADYYCRLEPLLLELARLQIPQSAVTNLPAQSDR
jgi:hypothetical protein